MQDLPKQRLLRHELALTIGEGEARPRLLVRNLKEFLNEIGGDRPEEAFRERPSIKRETFFELTDGAVQDLMALAAD